MMQTSYDLSDSHAPRFVMTMFTVDEFFGFWSQLEEMLDSVPHTWRHWTKDHICRTVAGDLMQVWGIGPPPHATLIIFTTVQILPAMKILTVPWAAGHLDEGMEPLVDATLMSYAQLNDCEEIEIRGRIGWEAKLKPLGFRRDAVVWTRSVSKSNLN
jgi:hypothetical protein